MRIKNKDKKEPKIINITPTPIEGNEVNKTTSVANKKKNSYKKGVVYRVMVATPSYFVISDKKDTIRIDRENNYRKGEEICF